MKLTQKSKSFYTKCKRVWFALKKPSREEFLGIAKISAIGILILGLLGFIVSFFMGFFTF